jgi:selenophosphate synthetase-related protein
MASARLCSRPWWRQENSALIDAVCLAVMGYDPMAVRGAPPFEKCDSTLQLAEELGVGPRDLKRIEMVGTPVREALFRFRV